MPEWNERYRRGEHIQRDPLPLLVEWETHIAAAAGGRGRALDLACGTGRHALFLVARGWSVVAVDASSVAIEVLRDQASSTIETCVSDLERGDFQIEPDGYDLILDCCYLYRPLFPAIRAGVRKGGIFFGAIPMIDDRPGVPPMNPAFLLNAGELEAQLAGWRILHAAARVEPAKRAIAELIAQRPNA